MKYLNNESQFTRVSDAHAKSLMESAGYEVPSEEVAPEEEVRVDVYAFEDARFALTEEVVEAEDGLHYIRLQELDESFTVSLDESGEEVLVEFVEFDEVDYILEGVFEDEDGNLYACMLSESDFEDDEDVEEVDENAEKGYKGMKGGSKEAKAEEMRRKKKAKKADKPAEEEDEEDED